MRKTSRKATLPRLAWWACGALAWFAAPAPGQAAPPSGAGASAQHWLDELASGDAERMGQAVAELLPRLNVEDALESRLAMQGLRKLRSKDAPVLAALRGGMASTNSPEVRAMAAIALCRCTGSTDEALPTLGFAMQQADNRRRHEVISLLLELGEEALRDGKETLRSAALRDPDISVRRASTGALNQLWRLNPGEGMLPDVSSGAEGPEIVLRGNGVPPHAFGPFPNPNCPRAMRLQTYLFVCRGAQDPLKSPVKNQGAFLFGRTDDGIPFDPWFNRFWKDDPHSGWRYNAPARPKEFGLDAHRGYVHAGGDYRYHGPPAWLASVDKRFGGMALIGVAADGHGVFNGVGHDDASDVASECRPLRSSYLLKKGIRPPPPRGPGGSYDGTFVEDYEYVEGAGDLDECNGRVGAFARFPDRVLYQYHITAEFPYVPPMFRSTPHESFRRATE